MRLVNGTYLAAIQRFRNHLGEHQYKLHPVRMRLAGVAIDLATTVHSCTRVVPENMPVR